MLNVKITERGWPGHFCGGHRCVFTRNTLIQTELDSVIVSTVGRFLAMSAEEVIDLGNGVFFETAVFGTEKEGPYIDIDVCNPRTTENRCKIEAESVSALPSNVDNIANNMHETIVQEFVRKLRRNDD